MTACMYYGKFCKDNTMKKLHANTQKAVNRYAHTLLKYYRQAKKKDPFVPQARFCARVKANQEAQGNVYCEIACRQLERYPRY